MEGTAVASISAASSARRQLKCSLGLKRRNKDLRVEGGGGLLKTDWLDDTKNEGR